MIIRFWEFSRYWQLTRLKTMIFVCTVVLVMIFVEAALLFGGYADHFQRFGSLMVAIGVIGIGISRWGISDFEELSEEWYSRGVGGGWQREGQVFAFWFFNRFLTLAEFGIIVVGILQWGYGDLLICWLHGIDCG